MTMIKMDANQRSNFVTCRLRFCGTILDFSIVSFSTPTVAPNFDAYLIDKKPYIGIDTKKIDKEPYFEIAISLEKNAKATNTTPHKISKIGIPANTILGMSGFSFMLNY